MPGSTGGGHSSGGGHGGSFGGGSRSSGGGHSSHSGSFGGGSRSSSSSRSYSGGGYRPVYRSGGSSYRRRSGSSGGGCLSSLLGVILIPLIVMFVLMVVVAGVFGNKGSTPLSPESYTGEISSEVVTREKLSASLCKPTAQTVETDLDVLNDAEIKEIEKALEGFYETTGVQPYFMLLGGLDGVTFPEYDAVDAFLYDKYVDTFGSDEGHLIVLMFFDNGDYESWYIPGNDALEIVSYDDCERILDLIDEYAADSTDVAGVISRAFTTAADEIMTTVEYHYYDDSGNEVQEGDTISDGAAMAIGLIFLLGITVTVVLVIRYIVKKVKASRKSASAVNTYTGNNTYQQVNAPQNTASGSYTPPAKPQRANYPVTCPHCGATAYPKDDGTCEYCGSRIM